MQLREVDAPTKLAPFTAALEANSVEERDGIPVSSGILVILHAPAGHEEWEGVWRLVATVTGSLEHEMVDDPFLGAVAWSWLSHPLLAAGAPEHLITGTVTRVLSETFGGLRLRGGNTRVEVRASWSPDSTDLAPSVSAWLEAVREAGGIAPEGVASLHRYAS